VHTSESGAASVFEILRGEIAIERLIETNGHRKALCVSHSEKDPSMHVYEDHVHCYGCGFHGDVVDVWAVQRGIERPIEAALDLAREFNVSLPEMNAESRQKAEEHRQKETDTLETARLAHAAMEEHRHQAREWWEYRGFCADSRQTFLLGSTGFGPIPPAIIIPFWHRGRVMGLIRRQLEGEPKYILPKAEEFPDGYRPLFIPGPLGREIFLVQDYIDALAVTACGRSAIAIGGTDISEAQSAELRKVVPEDATIYILTDDDESGREAARAWGREFFPRAKVCHPSYGEAAKDIADTFARDGARKTGEHLDRLMVTSKDMIDIETELAAEIQGGPREKLSYALENIVPLLTRVEGDALRDATADIVVERVTGLKKRWLNNGMKAEKERIKVEVVKAMMQKVEAEVARKAEEHREKVACAQEEIDALLAPGVLRRLRETAAAMHKVRGDEKALELALLVALGAQLEPLPNGRPLGASILITAQAGRGKNHIVDAAVKPLPEEFYFAFEIASGQSLYYKADEDPEFLKHTFAYPNEIEGAEKLWEFLRPMLSKGRAHKIVTGNDMDGNSVSREITVEGPVTIAIPTIRNKTDEQLQSRLLVAELPDYPGRVKEHSAAISAQLLPDAATVDHSHEVFLWQEGLRQLTKVRRMVFPLEHPDFAFDDDQTSHGARLWTNVLSLMATAAWLEQKNRQIRELEDGSVAIEATPDDYETAYRIFNAVCKRTVVNLSETHRKILNAMHDLQQEFSHREGFVQREIAKGADVSLSTVSENKTFLVKSAKLIRETDAGLVLVEGADPSWWATGELMEGLPTPAKVRSWWDERDPDPPEGAEHTEHPNKAPEQGQEADTYADSGVRKSAEQQPNTHQGVPNTEEAFAEHPEHVRQAFGEMPNTESGLGMENSVPEEGSVRVFGAFGGDEDVLFLEDEEEL
jgi:DNA primase